MFVVIFLLMPDHTDTVAIGAQFRGVVLCALKSLGGYIGGFFLSFLSFSAMVQHTCI
jgi:hypothetical protein